MAELQEPSLSDYMYSYAKRVSSLKIKSFYAYHLCKRNCLEHRLNSNPSSCFKECEKWLEQFFQLKKESEPLPALETIYEVGEKYVSMSQEEKTKSAPLYK